MFQDQARPQALYRRPFAPRLPGTFATPIGWMVATALLQCTCSTEAKAEAPARPNIVYIMADDLGYGDVKCFGGERCRIETPNFDRLAREGMRFTDAHTVASVCVPARVAIMTGRYAWRFRRPRQSGPWGFLNPQIPTDHFTLGKLLRKVGYRTGYVGKWHLGTLMETTDGKNQGPNNVDYSKPLKIGPAQYGFDESFILPGSLDMFPYAYVRNNRWVGSVTKQRGWSAFNRVGPAADDFEDYKVLDVLSGEAEQFIEKHAQNAKSGKPFFLYFALTSPHTPTSPRPEFRGRSRLGPYGDFVMETDDCVGRVLKALDRSGIAENTIVIATSDHGPAPYAGPRLKATAGQIHKMEAAGHFPSGPFRGYKFSAYEGGLRVPFCVRWPKATPAGTTCERLIGLNDLMATLAEVSRASPDGTQGPDSISYLSLLMNPNAPPTRTSLIMRSTQSFVVRSQSWKLALCPGSGCAGHLGNRPTAVEAWRRALDGRKPPQGRKLLAADFVQLFDLKTDPSESHDVSADHPDRIEDLTRHLEKAIRTGRTTIGLALENNVPHIRYLPRPILKGPR